MLKNLRFRQKRKRFSYEKNLWLRRKMLHQKHESYKYVMPLKNCVNWATTRGEKNVLT